MSRIATRDITVASTARVSQVIRNLGNNIFAFSLAGAITGTSITILAGMEDDALLTLKGDTGDSVAIVPDGAGLYLFPDAVRRFDYLQIDTGAAEAAARTITVYYQNG